LDEKDNGLQTVLLNETLQPSQAAVQ
jgi:hypothetical protein